MLDLQIGQKQGRDGETQTLPYYGMMEPSFLASNHR